MLTDEQLSSGLINTVRRWPNKRVPFFIDPMFCEYCNTKLQSGLRVVEGLIQALNVPLQLQCRLEIEWTK